MNWLPILLKSATSRGPGVFPQTWPAVEGRQPLPVPEEVRQLYQAADGARFSGEVRLWSWKEVEEHSAHGLGALAPSDAWLLGTKRETGIFFAALPRPLLRALPASARTNWLRSVPATEFVYGLWRAADDVFLVPSLKELLSLSIPRPGDDFGEVTYVRAMQAVKTALDALEPPAPRPSGPEAAASKSAGSKRSEVKTVPMRPSARPASGSKPKAPKRKG